MLHSYIISSKSHGSSTIPTTMNTDKLVTDNIGYVVTMAKQYAGRGVAMDDLISEGNMAMVDASRKYDPAKGKRFVSYAAPFIRHAMEQAIEEQAGLYRIPRSESNRETKKRKMPVSVDEPIPLGSNTGFNLLSVLTNGNVKQADLSIEDEETADRLKDILNILDDREREVITRYFGLGSASFTMAEIGDAMGLKRERVRQIRNKAIRKLRKKI